MTRKPAPVPVVLTASRRTDLVRWYPQAILTALAERYPPERVHTVILVTKFPGAILAPDLVRILAAYEQVTAQVTITGWGGTFLEPRVPAPAQALSCLPPLLEFLKDPRRLRVRLDPLLRLADGRDNIAAACKVMRAAASLGVTDFVTSIVTPYPKLAPRFAAAGLALAAPLPADRRAMIGRLAETAAMLHVQLAGCCLPELPPASCVDGRLLQQLHPRRLPCRRDHPSGQRAGCGCTHAVDLGWYATHPCYSSCLYCYANPHFPR